METVGLKMVRDISGKILDKWYTIMVNEATDFSNNEQVVLCLQYVDDELNGLYNVAYTSREVSICN